MMRIFLVAFLSFCFLVTSCKREKVSEVTEVTQQQKEDNTITQKDIESLRYDDYGLSADSQKAVTDWQRFQDLNIQTEVLKKINLDLLHYRNIT